MTLPSSISITYQLEKGGPLGQATIRQAVESACRPPPSGGVIENIEAEMAATRDLLTRFIEVHAAKKLLNAYDLSHILGLAGVEVHGIKP